MEGPPPCQPAKYGSTRPSRKGQNPAFPPKIPRTGVSRGMANRFPARFLAVVALLILAACATTPPRRPVAPPPPLAPVVQPTPQPAPAPAENTDQAKFA